MTTDQINPLVIIGTGLAGYNLAREFRKLDTDTPLMLISSDDGSSYSKPMLSAAFQKGKDAETLVMAGVEKMAEQLQATIRTHTQVSGLDPAARQLLIGDERVDYDRLVLAWGAEVLHAPLKGTAVEQVLSVNDLQDYARFRQQLDGQRKVLILGTGLIGCEFASDLSAAGFEVELVAPDQYPLQQLVPEPIGRALETVLRDAGVGIELGPFVTAVDHAEGAAHPYRISLSEGGAREADVVVSAIGLRPRVALAQEVGLACSRGIQVNQQLQTSDPNIYALGDCAEVSGHSLQYVLPLMAGARALARTLAGEPTAVTYPPMPVVVKTPACPVVALPPPADVKGQWRFEGEAPDLCGRFSDSQGMLRGFALCGARVADKMALSKEVPDLLPAP